MASVAPSQLRLTSNNRRTACGGGRAKRARCRGARCASSVQPQANIFKQILYDIRTNLGKSTPDKLEQAYQDQQELLKRRRNRTAINEAVERREKVSSYMKDKEAQERVKEEKRRKLREKGSYPEEGGNPFSRGGVIIPLPPFGRPEYDGEDSERFDLLGRYSEEGWVDEDADVMSKLGRLFSFGKGNKGE